MKPTNRHLRPELTIMVTLITVYSAIFALGTEDVKACLFTFLLFIAGMIILNRYGGE